MISFHHDVCIHESNDDTMHTDVYLFFTSDSDWTRSPLRKMAIDLYAACLLFAIGCAAGKPLGLSLIIQDKYSTHICKMFYYNLNLLRVPVKRTLVVVKSM